MCSEIGTRYPGANVILRCLNIVREEYFCVSANNCGRSSLRIGSTRQPVNIS